MVLASVYVAGRADTRFLHDFYTALSNNLQLARAVSALLPLELPSTAPTWRSNRSLSHEFSASSQTVELMVASMKMR